MVDDMDDMDEMDGGQVKTLSVSSILSIPSTRAWKLHVEFIGRVVSERAQVALGGEGRVN
jgi:hypothetical protein